MNPLSLVKVLRMGDKAQEYGWQKIQQQTGWRPGGDLGGMRPQINQMLGNSGDRAGSINQTQFAPQLSARQGMGEELTGAQEAGNVLKAAGQVAGRAFSMFR